MFDMDGVLFDSMKNHAQSWNQTMAHYGFDLPEKEAYLHEGRTGAATINIVCQRERGRQATEEEIRAIYGMKTQLFSQLPEPQAMTGAYELLQAMKHDGIVTMVVTGSGQRSLLDRLEHSFHGIFAPELMVTAFDVKRGKPDPEPYLMGLRKAAAYLGMGTTDEQLDALRQQAVVVENAPLGVQAGVAAGVFTIAVNTGPLPNHVLMDEGASLLFPSIQALKDNYLQTR